MELADSLRKHNAEQKSLAERGIVAKSIEDKLEASLLPRGSFNIPMLLDERRFQYGIPNGCFDQYPVFDKVYVWQIPTNERATYTSGGAILRPDAVVSHDRNTAPRGVIVSAGLQALDSLRSTGIDVGHIIRFKKFAPFIQTVDEIDGKELQVMVIRDGDIVASEDLAAAYHKKLLTIVNVATDATGYDHRFAREGSKGAVVHTGKKISGYYDPSV